MREDEIDFNQDYIESDPEVQAEVKKQLAGLNAYTQKLYERVDKMKLIHEDLVIVEKLDVRAIKSFIYFAEKSRFDQTRMSYVGRVIRVSSVASDNPINEVKKRLLKRGDIVSFNPDSAYSMNIIVPEEHPELWCLAIDNILFVDDAFDPEKAKAKSVEATILIERIAQNQKAEQMRRAEADLKSKMNRNSNITL